MPTEIDVDGLAQSKTALLKIHQALLAAYADNYRMLDASEYDGWTTDILNAALALDRAGRALHPTEAVGEAVTAEDRRLVGNIKWKSIDKDNMEYSTTISTYQRDALNKMLAALE